MRGKGLFLKVQESKPSVATVRVLGFCAAGALVAGVAGMGATMASPSAPQSTSMVDTALYPQTLADSGKGSGGELLVTVGKAVSITTDATGKPSLVQLVTNTQVSGNGSGKVLVPVGTTKPKDSAGFAPLSTKGDSIVYDVNSTAGEVKNLHASGGAYKGPVAVSLKTEAWLDGKSINPNDLVNVTGNVKIDYVITNNTSKKETLTYTNASMQQVTTDLDLPVPMGAAFSSTYGNGWADLRAPWAQTGISPSGQQLSGTAVLFPPIGGATQTLTVEARAQNATLPGASITAIPINLSTVAGGILMGPLPKTAEHYIQVGYGLVGTVEQKLLFYQSMLAKYSGVVADINRQYVEPLVAQIASLPQFTEGQLNGYVDQAAEGLDDLAALMTVNQQIANFDALMAKFVANGLTELQAKKVLPAILKLLSQIDSALAKLQPVVAQIVTALEDPATQANLKLALTTLANDLSPACAAANETNFDYGTDPGSGGKAALIAAIAALPGNSDLATLQKDLDAEVTDANGNAFTTCGALLLTPGVTAGLLKLAGNLPAIVTGLQAMQGYMVTAAKWLPIIVQKLTALNNNLPAYVKMLDNPNCPTAITELIALYKSGGIPGVLTKCGAVQVLTVIGQANGGVSTLLKEKVEPFVLKLKKYVPDVVKYEALAKKYAPMIGDAVAGAPALMDEYAALLGGYASQAGKAGATIEKLGDKLGAINASFVVMNNRAAAGEAIPYGNATGPNTTTLGAWQISMNGAATSKETSQNVIGIAIALLLFLITGGVGTVIYQRHNA